MFNSDQRPLVSFIATTYNQAGSVEELLRSMPAGSQYQWELVVVDDCSTDNTVQVLHRYATELGIDARIQVLAENSGGPALPRNVGLKLAQGKFVFFIDGDDVLIPENFDEIAQVVSQNEFDVLRLPMLIQVDEGSRQLVDRVKLSDPKSFKQNLADCITQQSMGVMCFIRRSVIEENLLEFDPAVKMGEDLVFMAEVASRSEYLSFYDAPLYCYRKSTSSGSSTTTSLNSRTVRQAISSWQKVQDTYLERGVDFLKLHGVGTVSYVLSQVQRYLVPIDDETFSMLGVFARRNKASLDLDRFSSVNEAILRAAMEGRRNDFDKAIKPRLLIAGHDLKFIEGSISALEEVYQVSVDKWPSERVHDESRSEEHLEWAQLIWVEWMTEAAVWYSKRVRPSQTMVTRCHFYELTRNSGFEMDRERVSAVITIALHTYEDAIERFGFKREGVRLIPNYYDVEAYAKSDVESRDPFAIALVGSVPRRKGLHRALELLKRLREHDERFTLTIFGKSAKDFPWVRDVPTEMDYYRACETFMNENDLDSAVSVAGWTDMRRELGRYGCVLSVSDFEGSHVAPGEAFCADIPMAVLSWRGAEFVYPNEFIFDSIDEMEDYILGLAEDGVVPAGVSSGRAWLDDYQGLPAFVRSVTDLFKGLPTSGEVRTSPLL